MAKKKEATVVADEPEAIEEKGDFTASILKKYGKGILRGGNDILAQDIQVIPMSPNLDMLLGGGVPEGSWLNFSSKSGVGKTTTALHFAATCQKKEYGERDVYYLDIEGRLKEKNLKGIKGLNLDKFHAICSTEDKILTAQDFLTIGEDILKNTKRSVLIVDSYSMLCHENELLGGIGTSTRGSSGYQLLAGFTRQMCQVVPVRRHIVIGIAQMMANVSGYGAGMVEKGGNSIMYQADIWLRAKGMEMWEVGGKPIGQKVKWSAVKTAMHGAVAGAEIDSYIRYGIGVDVIRELMDFACDIGLIEKTTQGRYTCTYMQNHADVVGVKEWNDETIKMIKFHGDNKMYNHFEENPKWIELLEKDIKNVLGGN